MSVRLEGRTEETSGHTCWFPQRSKIIKHKDISRCDLKKFFRNKTIPESIVLKGTLQNTDICKRLTEKGAKCQKHGLKYDHHYNQTPTV